MKKVAVKVLNTGGEEETSQENKDEMLQEFSAMASMVHPNIVRLYGVVMDNGPNPSIVIEFFPNGDLKSYLKVID